MKIIGITGPSGSGKTTLLSFLKDEDIAVIDCDKVAREAVEVGSECLHKLVGAFGGDILNADGTLNRAALSQKAFASQADTGLLNSITHPYITALIKKKINAYRYANVQYVILDAPTLFEAGADSFCDLTVCVIADMRYRRERLALRDSLDEKQLDMRLKASGSDEFYISRCDITIYNDGSAEELKKQARILADAIR